MPIYNAPLADMKFILNDVFNADQFWQSNENLAHVDSATAEAILEEMAKFAQNVTLPLNRTGDEEGATFSNGAVTTPAGFKEAFKQYAEGGWIGLAADEEWGGQGMPKMLTVLADEMLFATNPSFMLYPLLSVGAGMALNSYASQEQKETYLPKIYSGEWSGTMCLTEPHAGTDLGIIKTKAERNEDGTYNITGTKIFITGGDHDLAENIIHLVLAKTPDAPAGPRGISLFIVPKFLVNADGSVGERNAAGLYLKYAKQLVEQGDAYYCFCDAERLSQCKRNVGGKEISIYDKHCLGLSKEEVEANLAAGKPYVIRFNMPTEGTTTFHDEIYGDITVNNEELEDLILIKSDGYPTYNFANVIDDHLMGVTHVVRGNEYLSSSPKYNRIYEAFGWEVPVYVHCPLITNEEHQKLSKRCGHSSYEDLIYQGFLKDAIVNFVALLGWSPEGNREIYSLEELVKIFDYHHISKSPAVFDMTKLRWMNGEYIARTSSQ